MTTAASDLAYPWFFWLSRLHLCLLCKSAIGPTVLVAMYFDSYNKRTVYAILSTTRLI